MVVQYLTVMYHNCKNISEFKISIVVASTTMILKIFCGVMENYFYGSLKGGQPLK